MGYAPFLFAAGQATDKGKTVLEGSHIQPYRAGSICFPKFPHPLTNEHERYSPPVIALHMVERATDAMKERGKIQIVGDD
jgi:hypothetical protein